MSTRRQPLFPVPEKPATAKSPPSFKSKDHPIATKATLYLLITLLLFSALLLISLTSTPLQHRRNSAVCPAGILPFYVIPLPPKFNSDLLSRCHDLNIYTDMCPYVTHSGLGEPLAAAGWFSTHQFIAEVIFHNRALHHPCRVHHPSAARLFYVPFYAGLYASSVFLRRNFTDRDSLAVDLAGHITSLPWWLPNSGRDHFLVSGRTAWDFLRIPAVTAADDFGANSLLNLPAIRNMSVLTVERQPWDHTLRQHGIPYPSYFHPSNRNKLSTWQKRVLSTPRPHLFSFVGATRRGLEKAAVRDLIIKQCAESKQCKLLDCSGSDRVGLCYDPTRVIQVMENSRFCLQAPGDSYTRRSTFDAMLAGCVPVFFSEHTAYSQYSWYLPAEKESYSVFIDEKSDDVARIEAVLAGIPESKMAEMRESIVRRILPKVTYMHPEDREGDDVDAVDVALKALSDELNGESSAVTDSVTMGRADIFGPGTPSVQTLGLGLGRARKLGLCKKATPKYTWQNDKHVSPV